MSLIGLVLHELAANATRFGAWSEGADGQVGLHWKRAAGNLVLTWVETGGPDMGGAPAVTGSGMHAVLTVPIKGKRM